jgi:hypothetical protein
MGTKYYKVHGGRLSFAEYWRMAPDPFTFVLCAGMKLFGGMAFDFSIPRVEELHYLDEAEVPKAAMKRIRGSIKRLTEAGFAPKFYHEMPVLEDHRLGLAACLLADDRRTFGMVMYARERDEEQTHVTCASRFADGTFGSTTTQKKMMKPDPQNKVARYPGAAADEIYDRHLEHLEEWEGGGLQVRKLDDAALAAAVLEGEQQHIDFHAERGVYVPMSKAEVRRIREANTDDDED